MALTDAPRLELLDAWRKLRQHLKGRAPGQRLRNAARKYAHLDSEHLSRQDRVHLDFQAPAAKVASLPDRDGPPVDRGALPSILPR